MATTMTDGRPPRPDIPDFDLPPVTEMTLGLQFPPVPGLSAAHLALFWGGIRDRYPVAQEQAPLDPAEEPESPLLGQPGIRVEMMSMPGPARLWFLTSDGSELVQIQADRFIRNWRRLSPDVQYPRYEPLRESFVADFEAFANFLASERMPAVAPSLCEVTYINHIAADVGNVFHGHDDVARVVNWGVCAVGLPPLEDFRASQRHVLRDPDGTFRGRLYIGLEPVRRVSDGVAAFALTLTARGAPKEPTFGAALELLDRGRREIVEAFAAVTTPQMHELWKRRR